MPLHQQDTDKGYTAKAGAILTLALTLAVAGKPWDGITSDFTHTKIVLVTALSLCVLLITVLALWAIVRPREFKTPYDLHKYGDRLSRTIVQEHLVLADNILIQTYIQAVDYNERLLESKASCISKITVAAIVELVCFSALKGATHIPF